MGHAVSASLPACVRCTLHICLVLQMMQLTQDLLRDLLLQHAGSALKTEDVARAVLTNAGKLFRIFTTKRAFRSLLLTGAPLAVLYYYCALAL